MYRCVSILTISIIGANQCDAIYRHNSHCLTQQGSPQPNLPHLSFTFYFPCYNTGEQLLVDFFPMVAGSPSNTASAVGVLLE